ncbi:hypothetical protein [Actinomadura roseirufa]|uniref:hypothetical protein n=1 Tax=Actinomadura roseirufa TaxID=2094049 RepID=UPI0010412834|nr:hypothetical protein [Actinomadura roseirufa]
MPSDRPLRLAAVRHLPFGRNPAWPDLSVQAEYFAERLAGPGAGAGAVVRPVSGNRNGYAWMAERLLAALPGEPDLVVLAHALPDCDMSVSLGGYLTHAAAGRPMVLAVSEQGRATPFAALRLAGAHPREEYPAVAVLVLDQNTLFYDDPALADLDASEDHAVGLLFTPDGPVGFGPAEQRTGVAPERAAELVADEVRALGPGTAVLVAGTALAPPASAAHERRAPRGGPCTSVWSEFAARLAEPVPADRTILVAEYEPALGYLSLAACDVPAGWSC